MEKLLPYLCALAGVLIGGVIGYAAAPNAQPRQPEPNAKPAIRSADGLATGNDRPVLPQARPAPVIEPARELPQYGGQISGRIVAEDGEPLAGVPIRAKPVAEPMPAGATPEQELRAFASAKLLERAAASDADGRFTLSELDPARHYTLEPWLDGWAFSTKNGGRTFSAGSEADFTATASAVLRVDLRTPDSRAPHIGRILMMRDREADSRRFWTWTPFNTEYALPPGEWSLEITAGEFHEFVAEPHTVSITAGKPVEPLEIQLRALGGIVGRVIPAAGMGNARLEVQLMQERNGVFAKPEGADGQSINAQTSLSASHAWHFQFIGLTSGRYCVELILNGAVVETRELTVEADTVNVELRAPEPDVNEYIVVRASGPDGPVSAGLQFVLSCVEGNRSSSGGGSTIYRGKGEYWLTRTESRFIGEDGWYVVRVSSRKYGDRSFRYERADRDALEIVLDPPAYINVEIVGFDDHSRRAELKVSVSPTGRREDRRASGVGSEGSGATRRFGPMEPGEYVVQLLINRQEHWSFNILANAKTTVAPGDNRVSLTAPPLYSFTVEVPEQYRGSQLSVLDAQSYSRLINATHSGLEEFEATMLKQGEYLVMANPFGQMRVSLPQADGRRLLFQPLPFNAYRLQAVGGEPGHDVGLRDGDFVLAMDGNSLEDYDHRHDYVRESLAQETTTWTIQRDGVRMNITFKTADWRNARLTTQPARAE